MNNETKQETGPWVLLQGPWEDSSTGEDQFDRILGIYTDFAEAESADEYHDEYGDVQGNYNRQIFRVSEVPKNLQEDLAVWLSQPKNLQEDLAVWLSQLAESKDTTQQKDCK